jgi:hypothetical protein
MKEILQYIGLPKTERQLHIDLTESCIERGGNSFQFKGLLAYYLDTKIPKGNKIHLCHACHNGNCSNPKHLYWGTPKENNEDAVQNGKKTIWEYMVEKYGEEAAREIQRHKGNKNGVGNKGKAKSNEHKLNISQSIKSGWEIRSCKNCGKPTRRRQKYCSYECSDIGQRRVERPPIDDLIRMVAETSYSAVARQFGVSDNAVRKWLGKI